MVLLVGADNANPSPHEDEIARYNRKVEEFLTELQARYPRNNVETLRDLAEQIAAPYMFQTKEAERPH